MERHLDRNIDDVHPSDRRYIELVEWQLYVSRWQTDGTFFSRIY